MRVEVLTPLQHEGEVRPVGTFIELPDDVVLLLRGAVGQEHVPAPDVQALPAPDPQPVVEALRPRSRRAIEPPADPTE